MQCVRLSADETQQTLSLFADTAIDEFLRQRAPLLRVGLQGCRSGF